MPVVGNDRIGPIILLQRFLQNGLGFHIEVVRRLVHDEKIRRLEKHLGKGETAFLTARKDGDFLEDIVPMKKERA